MILSVNKIFKLVICFIIITFLPSCSIIENTKKDLGKSSKGLLVFQKSAVKADKRRYPRDNKRYLVLNQLASENAAENKKLIKEKNAADLVPVKKDKDKKYKNKKSSKKVDPNAEVAPKKPGKINKLFGKLFKSKKTNDEKDLQEVNHPAASDQPKDKIIAKDIDDNAVASPVIHEHSKKHSTKHIQHKPVTKKHGAKVVKPVKAFPKISEVPQISDKLKDKKTLQQNMQKDIDELHLEMDKHQSKIDEVTASDNGNKTTIPSKNEVKKEAPLQLPIVDKSIPLVVPDNIPPSKAPALPDDQDNLPLKLPSLASPEPDLTMPAAAQQPPKVTLPVAVDNPVNLNKITPPVVPAITTPPVPAVTTPPAAVINPVIIAPPLPKPANTDVELPPLPPLPKLGAVKSDEKFEIMPAAKNAKIIISDRYKNNDFLSSVPVGNDEMIEEEPSIRDNGASRYSDVNRSDVNDYDQEDEDSRQYR
jgi:hypothetical protein